MSILIHLIALLIITCTTPCPVEDSNYCYWDAQTRGNHQGSSFITYNDHTYLLPGE